MSISHLNTRPNSGKPIKLVLNYLSNERKENPKMNEIVRRLNERVVEDRDVYNNIYRLKLEKSKSDAVFADNKFNSKVGSVRSKNLLKYQELVSRYTLSKSLAVSLDSYPRNHFRQSVNCMLRVLKRRGYNYGLKAFLGFTLLVNIQSYYERQQKSLLSNTQGLNGKSKKGVYRSLILFCGSLILI